MDHDISETCTKADDAPTSEPYLISMLVLMTGLMICMTACLLGQHFSDGCVLEYFLPDIPPS